MDKHGGGICARNWKMLQPRAVSCALLWDMTKFYEGLGHKGMCYIVLWLYMYGSFVLPLAFRALRRGPVGAVVRAARSQLSRLLASVCLLRLRACSEAHLALCWRALTHTCFPR